MRRLLGALLVLLLAGFVFAPRLLQNAFPFHAQAAAVPGMTLVAATLTDPGVMALGISRLAPQPVDLVSDPRLERHYQYILASQTPEGAIAFNRRHLYANPYFGNLAVRALLTSPDHLGAAQRHMDWYIANLNADGTIDDFERKGGELKRTGSYDSADSYAATFFTVIARYLEAGGDPDWVIHNRGDLHRIEEMLIGLTDKDGLTWAKPRYWLKYLMDNAEVYAGWLDWAEVLEQIGEPQEADLARERAAALKEGFERFRQSDGHWAWGLDRVGLQRRSDMRQFYPDAVAQLFPGAWGLDDGAEAYLRFDLAQPQWRQLTASDFPWTFPVFAAREAGRAEVLDEVIIEAQERYPHWEPRWFVTESAWIILAGVEQPR